jgi:putative ABC transport system permease protein
LFGTIKIIGVIIGGFSMVVGCFGVANIMFVSVKERTQEIGIQKALGAKRGFILSQFLTESVILCIIGGLIGLGLVWGTLQLLNFVLQHQLDSGFVLYLMPSDVLLGIGVSVVVGLLAGFLPASSGAKLNPVDAIRSK